VNVVNDGRLTRNPAWRGTALGKPDRAGRPGNLEATVSVPHPSPIVVVEVLRFEDLPLGSRGSRRAVVRWSDGTEDDGLVWYADEILVSEGDLIGKTRAQLRSLLFRRDRDWLQS